jgi:hypothetical protein
MARGTKPPARQRGLVLGREAFAAISAIEGLKVPPEMDELFREFDRLGLSPEERRAALIKKYGSPKQSI